MATLAIRLADEDYKYWLKTGLCLGLVKEGLEDFADHYSKRLHQHVLHQLGSSTSVCSNAKISHDKVTNKWKMKCCLNCEKYIDELDRMKSHGFKFTQENWNNSNVQLWPNEPWEMAKVYMNKGQKANHLTSKETDLSGILNFVDHCITARSNISSTCYIYKVRDARNQVMHSGMMKMTQQDFKTHSNDMIALLEDPLYLKATQRAQDSVQAIKEIQQASFQITAKTEFEILTKQLTHLLEQHETLKTDFQHIHTKWQELENANTTDHQNLRFQLETETKERENEIKKLTQSFIGLKKIVQSDDNLCQKMGKDLEVLETAVRENFKELQNIIDRLGKLEQEVKKLKEDIAQKTFATPLEDTFITDCEKLKQHLLEEYQRIHFNVSLSPIYEGLNDDVLQVPVDELYTDVTIVRPDRKAEIALKSYKEMFFNKDTRNRTIFVKGEAGVGKTTWCMQLVNAWCKAHGNPSDDDANTTENISLKSADKDMIEAIKQFKFLILVQLRYVEGITSVKDLIFSSTLERLANYDKTFKKIIEELSEDVLIVLDGLDEYIETLDYKGLYKCTVISTTRPWKYDVICSKNPKLKVDQILKIKGLNSEGVSLLTRKVLKLLTNTMQEKEKGSKMVEDIDIQADSCLDHLQAVGLSESVKIPLILIFMVECWFENEKQLSPSLTCNLISLIKILLQRGKQKLSEGDRKMHKSMKCSWRRNDIPACFKGDSKIAKHYGLLLEMANLSYQGLSSSSKESSLVFKEKQLNQYFKPGETDICYKFGFLSKSKLSTSLTGQKRVSVSFYHKLVQEFFAALWIIAKNEAFNAERDSLKSISSILEMENVVLFVCGLEPSKGSELTKHFVSICKNDNAVVQHREEGKNYRTLDSFTKLIRKCREEVNHSSDPERELYLSDIFIIWGKIDDTLSLIAKHSTRYLQSLLLDNLEISSDNWCTLMETIHEAHLLQRLVIYLTTVIDRNSSRKMKDVPVDFSGHTSLRRVTFLDGVQDIPGDTPWLPLFGAVSGATNITEFTVSYIVPDCVDALTDAIPKLENLQMLSVTNISFEHRRLLIKNTKLKVMKIRNLEFINNGCILLKNVEHLEEVHIDTLQVQTKSWGELFEQLTSQSHLRVLDIADLDIGEAILKLDKSKHLQRLSIWRVQMSQNSWSQLFTDLSTLASLHILELISIEVEDAVLKLENNTDLEMLTLADVKMAQTSWNWFFETLPLFQKLRSLSLQRLQVGPVSFQVSANTNLQELQIWAMVSSQVSWIHLFHSLETLPSLKKLKLMNLNIGTSILKVAKSIKELEVYKLTLTEDSWQDSFTRIKSMFDLESVSIDLDSDILTLPKTANEEGVTLQYPKCLGMMAIKDEMDVVEEVFMKHPFEIKMARVSFNLAM